MRRIEIDEDVYGVLESNVKGFESPNDVLRRLLGVDASGGPVKSASLVFPRGTAGKLKPLLDAGLVHEDEELICSRDRKGDVLRGRIVAGGFIETERGTYASPSPALKELAGYEIDGWANWYHVKSELRLRDLRAKLRVTS